MTLPRQVPRTLWLLFAALCLGWACGYDSTLRAYLDAHFWLPYAKQPSSFLKKNIRHTAEPYAGMAAYKISTLDKLSHAYSAISDPDRKSNPTPGLQQTLDAARVDPSLTAAQREEVALIDAKIEMRIQEASDQPDFTAAEIKLNAFLQTARTPTFLSEARGWLAHIYYKQSNQAAAGKIYLDELNRNGSNLSREVLLNSLKLIYGYDGGPDLLKHLDEYFDTPEHAAFAIQLATNPHWDRNEDLLKKTDTGEKETTYERIRTLIENHSALLKSDDGSNALGVLGMRLALRMGDPPGALKIASAIPPAAAVHADPDFNWMLASANFLAHNYAAAEAPLLKLFHSPAVTPVQKASAAYGLCGVYLKLGNIVEQIRFALWLRTAPQPEGYFDMPPIYMAASGFDLGLLLDSQASVEDIENFLKKYPGLADVNLVKYSLAVRLTRENRYTEAAEIYESIHDLKRGPRMRQLASLYDEANHTGTAEAQVKLAEFIGANQEKIYFNDRLWHRFQKEALRAATDARLTREERDIYIAKERELQDDQEERWRAWLILQKVVAAEGKSALGRKAALLAISYLDKISIERFGRKEDIQKAEGSLIAGLRRH